MALRTILFLFVVFILCTIGQKIEIWSIGNESSSFEVFDNELRSYHNQQFCLSTTNNVTFSFSDGPFPFPFLQLEIVYNTDPQYILLTFESEYSIAGDVLVDDTSLCHFLDHIILEFQVPLDTTDCLSRIRPKGLLPLSVYNIHSNQFVFVSTVSNYISIQDEITFNYFQNYSLFHKGMSLLRPNVATHHTTDNDNDTVQKKESASFVAFIARSPLSLGPSLFSYDEKGLTNLQVETQTLIFDQRAHRTIIKEIVRFETIGSLFFETPLEVTTKQDVLVSFSRTLTANGFHPELHYLLSPLGPGPRDECMFAVVEFLPASLFVDEYQLADRKDIIHNESYVFSSIDLEVPITHEKATQNVVVTLIPPGSHSVNLPLHYRYQAPEIGEGFVTIPLFPPKLYTNCHGTWDPLSTHNMNIQPLHVLIPHGNLDDLNTVSFLTLTITVLGALFIVYFILKFKIESMP